MGNSGSGNRTKGADRAARYAKAAQARTVAATLPDQTPVIRAKQDRKLSNCYRLSLDRLREILSAKALDNAGTALQISAAKAIFGRLDNRAKQVAAADAKPSRDVLNDMSLADLRAFAAKREAEITVIDNASVATPDDASAG